jgi:hypothetical protein
MRHDSWVMRWIGMAGVLPLAAALALAPVGLSSAGTPQAIGVVNFAVRPSVPSIPGLSPGRFAADDTTALLQRTAPASLSVISRTAMTHAQSALSWRDTDITNSARLNALAAGAHAAHLVIGTVDRLNVEGQSSSASRARATVHIQVFTPPAWITEAVTDTGTAVGTGSVSRIAAQQALHQVIQQVLPLVVSKIPFTR